MTGGAAGSPGVLNVSAGVCLLTIISPGFVHGSVSFEHRLSLRSPKPLRSLPVCFKRATVVPTNLAITPEALHIIQTALVNVWQQHIKEWHSAEPLATVVAPPTSQSSANAEVPVEKRGHVLRPRGRLLLQMRLANAVC